MFSKYGPIEQVQVVYDHQTGRSRGFAFIYYEDTDDAIDVSEKIIPLAYSGGPIYCKTCCRVVFCDLSISVMWWIGYWGKLHYYFSLGCHGAMVYYCSDVDILCVAGIGMGIGEMTYHKTDKA